MGTVLEQVKERAVMCGLSDVARMLGSNQKTVASWLAGLCRPATAAWLEAKAREVYGEALDKEVGQ